MYPGVERLSFICDLLFRNHKAGDEAGHQAGAH